MVDDIEEIAESEWREGFRHRIREAQGNRTQEQMSQLLGITRDRWAKIVGARSTNFPIRLLTKFCAICDRDLIWLLDGHADKKAARPDLSGLRSLMIVIESRLALSDPECADCGNASKVNGVSCGPTNTVLGRTEVDGRRQRWHASLPRRFN